MAVFILKIIV